MRTAFLPYQKITRRSPQSLLSKLMFFCQFLAMYLGAAVDMGLAQGSIAKSNSIHELEKILGVDGLESPDSSTQSPPGDPSAAKSDAEKALDQLVGFALQIHPSLALEQAKVDQAQTSVNLAESRFWPVASLGADASISRNKTQANERDSFTRDQSASANIRQNLWRGGQDQLEVKQQKIGLDAAALGQQGTKKAIEWQVRAAALRYNQAAMDLVLAQKSVKNSKEVVDLSTQKSQAGQVGKIDVMQSEQQYREALALEAQAQLRLEQAFGQLEAQLLMETNRRSQLSVLLAPLREKALVWPNQGWRKLTPEAPLPSFELRQQQQATLQKEIDVQKAQRDRWLPTLDLSLSYRNSRAEVNAAPNPVTSDGAQNFRAQIDLLWPLWDGTKHYSREVALQEQRILKAKEIEIKNSLSLGYRNSQQHLERLFQLFDFKKSSFEQSEALYQARLKLYTAGAIDILTVTNASQDRLRSLQSWYETICELQTEWFRLQAMLQGVKI